MELHRLSSVRVRPLGPQVGREEIEEVANLSDDDQGVTSGGAYAARNGLGGEELGEPH